MILELFAVLVFLSLILIYLGYYGENDILRMVGYTMLFILSFVLFDAGSSGIDYVVGEDIIKYENLSDADYVVTTYEIAEVTDTYQSHSLGFVMIILSFVGFATVFYDRKGVLDD